MKFEYNGFIPVLMIGMVLGAAGGYFISEKENAAKSQEGKYAVLDECLDIIKKSGNTGFNEDKAYLGALNGYLKEGGDEYTAYRGNSDVEEVTKYVNESGTAIASGFQIDISDDGGILVTEVKEDMAAYRAGIREGDIIVFIDGVSVVEKGYENIANKLLGKQDTEVELGIWRKGNTLSVTFKRDHFYVRDMSWGMLENNTALIKIDEFTMLCAGAMSEAVEEIGGADKFVIDLRGCVGGATEIALQCMDYFTSKGSVYMHYNNGDEKVLETTDSLDDITAPIAVLVNGETASAGEISASLLSQFGKNVTLIGEQTFGKGIFQSEAALSDGGILRYTTGYFTVGAWDCWQGIGITPDIVIEMDPELIGTNDDIQLQKAIEILG